MTVLTAASGTRDRLLATAGEVFADKGFRDATVREIVERAEANIASVNYHFGGKAELYEAVLQEATRRLAAAFAVPAEALVEGEPALRLERFLRAFLARLLEERPDSWPFRLLAREMASEGRLSPQALVAPVHEHLVRLATELEPGLSPEAAALCSGSILGQCFHFHHARQLLGLAEDAVVDHLLHFTLGGLGRRASREESR